MKKLDEKPYQCYHWHHITDKRAATLKLIKEFGECIKG